MKFGQLIEFTMRNVFLEKSYTKCDGETIPRPFSKKSKLSIFLDQHSKVLYSAPLLYVHVEGYQNILKLGCRLLGFTWHKAFLKNKKKSEISFPTPFSHGFCRKISLTLYFINWPNFIVWWPLLLEMLDNMCIVIILFSRLWRHNFESNLCFLIKPFSHLTKNV